MMDCLKTRDLLNDYIDDSLPRDERSQVQAHLESCPACMGELQRLQSLLARAASLPRAIEPAHDLWKGIAARIDPAMVRPSTASHRPKWKRVFAIAAMLALLVGAYLLETGALTPSWSISGLDGSPSIGRRPLAEKMRLEVGQLVQTDASSRAKISNRAIGTVDVEPNTRLKLISKSLGEQRFALERGAIKASTWVPPQVFMVETPSGVAVDLGCEYRLTVDDSGRSLLLVTAGWVSLGSKDRVAIIPAAAFCETRPGMAPGTPFSEYASDSLKHALEDFDFGAGGTAALGVVLAQSHQHDAVTLWHLISRVGENERPGVVDRLDALVSRPQGVTRDGVLRLDKSMLDRWWDEFERKPLTDLRSKPSLWALVWHGLRNFFKQEVS
jgi:hypothetical protein